MLYYHSNVDIIRIKWNSKRICNGFRLQYWIFFSAVNEYCSAEDRPKKLKLASFRPPGNEDSEYVYNIFLACL